MDDLHKQLQQMLQQFPGLLINLQVSSAKADQMVQEASKISEYGENFIVKVPCTFEGLKALKEIGKLGLKTNATLCFSFVQAKMAQDLGATYISPFLGRMQDAGHDIAEFVYKLRKVVVSSKILAASLRNVEHVELAVAVGCDAITINEQVFDSIFSQSLLQKGQAMFDALNKISYL